VRRFGERGAISFIVVFFMSLLVLVLAVAVMVGRARTASERAWTGAEAVAHGVAGAANSDAEHRDELSIQAQSGRDCATGELSAPKYTSADESLCKPLIAVANDIAYRDGVHVVGMLIGPNVGDLAAQPAPGRLDVLVIVSVDGPLVGDGRVLPGAGKLCDLDDFRYSGWCHPRGAMGAEVLT